MAGAPARAARLHRKPEVCAEGDRRRPDRAERARGNASPAGELSFPAVHSQSCAALHLNGD